MWVFFRPGAGTTMGGFFGLSIAHIRTLFKKEIAILNI
jgi:hypothetical protein